MSDDTKEVEETEPEKEASKPQSKGFMKLILIGVVVFVIAIGGFSMMMGVFSSPGGDQAASTEATDTTVVQADSSEAVADAATDTIARDTFSVESLDDVHDMDDLAKLAEKNAAGISKDDSVAAMAWLKREMGKIIKERSELDKKASDLDKQEYRLKQLIAKVDQMESARVTSLARLYDDMKPEQVALLVNKLPDNQAVQILLKMKPANAAKILGELTPDRAARVSAKMITLTED